MSYYPYSAVYPTYPTYGASLAAADAAAAASSARLAADLAVSRSYVPLSPRAYPVGYGGYHTDVALANASAARAATDAAIISASVRRSYYY